MKNIIKKIKISGLIRSVGLVFTSTALGYIIPFISIPVLSRLYSPESFGEFAIYVSTLTIIIHIATGKYELAIYQPRSKRNRISIICLVTIISLFTAVLFSISYLIFFGIDGNIWFFYFAGLVFNAQFLVVNNYYVVIQKYQILSLLIILKSIVTVLIQVGFGLWYPMEKALIVGYVLGFLIFSVGFYFYERKDLLIFLKNLKLRDHFVVLEKNAKKYFRFPKYTILSHSLNSFSNQLPVYVIDFTLGAFYSGLFSVSNKNIGVPFMLLSNSIGQIFRQQFSNLYDKDKVEGYKFFKKTIFRLAIIGLVPFLILLFFSPMLFSTVLGENWRQAGEITQFLSIFLYVRFIFGPVSYVFYALNRQKQDLFWQVLLLLMVSLSLYVGVYFGSVFDIVKAFSISYSLFYFFNLIYLKSVLKSNIDSLRIEEVVRV